jgi:hypothetical protein
VTYDTGHALFTVHGTLGVPVAEEWSFGIRLLTAGPLTQAQCASACSTMVAPTAALFAAVATDPAKLTHIKCAYIQPDGHYPPGQSAGEFNWPTPVGIGGTPTANPFQTALAVTLTTAITRGNANKGRLFLPLPKFQRDQSGLIQTTDATTVANVMKTWLQAFATATPILIPRVFSKGGKVDPTPVSHNITGIKVGRVLDTIRSRRRSLPESYVVLSM